MFFRKWTDDDLVMYDMLSHLYIKPNTIEEHDLLRDLEKIFANIGEKTLNREREKIHLKLAKKGDLFSQYYLGSFYYQYIDEKPNESFRWLTNAANAGSKRAMCQLALNYYESEYRRAFFENNPENYLHWMRQAAENGSIYAQCELGRECLIQQDRSEAKKWYQRAASQGSIVAYYELGAIFDSPINPERNKDIARTYYLTAIWLNTELSLSSENDASGSAAHALAMMHCGEAMFATEPVTVSADDLRIGAYWLLQALFFDARDTWLENLKKLLRNTNSTLPEDVYESWHNDFEQRSFRFLNVNDIPGAAQLTRRTLQSSGNKHLTLADINWDEN